MFVLIWVTISLSVRNNDAVEGQPVWGQERCQIHDYCVTLNDAAVTAEAGLCAVIPCSFKSPFIPQNITWFKCDPAKETCEESDRISVFTSTMNSSNVNPEFRGRVSLLEPDVHRKNCSILINDLRGSDSGSYQLRVEGKETKDKFTFTVVTAPLSVTGLNQKPRLMVPPLTEGHQTSLTCIAPGLCSGSPPKFTWTWTGKGEKDFGNNTETLTALSKRHLSTLTFTPSARHHGASITCKISFTGDITTEETVTLNVTYVKKVKISGNPRVKEGEPLNLTCSVKSFPPSFITWTKSKPDSNLQNDSLINQRTESGLSSFLIPNATAENSGLYICTVTHLNNTIRKEVNASVTYARKPQITGNPSVKEGEDLKLTCSIDSFPPSVISWTRSRDQVNQNRVLNETENRPEVSQQDGTGLFFITSVTAGDAGLYFCTAEHLNTTLMEAINVTVMYARKPQITGNKEVKEGEDLNLTCSIDSFPPSVISWTRNTINLQSNNSSKMQNGTEVSQQDGRGIGSFSVTNVTAGDAGLYFCTAEHLNTTLMEAINVTVIYKREPQILGETTVKEGDDLNLTCRAESFPASVIKWFHHSTSGIYVQRDPGSATVFFSNVTTEDSGLYICTAEHLDGNVTLRADVTVTWFSKILTGSGCFRQSEVLTCVCISEGFPLPTIQWPLLKEYTDYSVITTVSNHTVNSTVAIRHHGNSSVECFSSNENGEAAENLKIHLIKPGVAKADQPQNHQAVSLKVVAAAFFFGGILSAAICCLALKYYRKKQKNAGNLDEAQEMITADPSIYSSPAVRADWSKVQEAADDGAAAAEEEVPGFKGGPKELVYASIDFSSWRPRAGAIRQHSSETEYAQIKIRNKMEDDAVEVTEEDEETNDIVQVEECSDEAVYSNVKDLSGGI